MSAAAAVGAAQAVTVAAERSVEPKLCPQGQPERPRLAEERRVELGRTGDQPSLYSARRAASLHGRVEGDLDVVLVEQVLRPKLDRPGVVRPVDADAAVEHREGPLHLLDVEIRAGIEELL